MGLFGDLPAALVKKPTSDSAQGPDLEAQLAKLRKVDPSPQTDDDEEGDSDAESSGNVSEEAPQPQDLRRRPRPRDEDEAETERSNAAPVPQPLAKRVRIHDDVVTATFEPCHAAPVAPPKPGDEDDPVTSALRKIASHIGNAAKFPKASPLLRKLLDGSALAKAHQPDLFEAIRAAFCEPATCAEPTLRREYMKLIGSIANRPDLFGRAERAHMDIYRLVGHVQNQMSTDDNFQFNKALTHVREAADELADATPEDEEALMRMTSYVGNAWVAPGSAHADDARLRSEQYQRAREDHKLAMKRWEREQDRLDEEEERAQQQHAEVEEGQRPDADEADPFGLDTLLAEPARPPPGPRRRKPPPAAPAAPPASVASTSAWDATEVGCMRREAVVQCLATAKGFHKLAWARTGVELLVEHCHENRSRFCVAQQPALEELMAWVRQQRALRKQGPSAREVNRDSTTFDRARAEWSKKATVSHRGKVGGGGDTKSNNWLG